MRSGAIVLHVVPQAGRLLLALLSTEIVAGAVNVFVTWMIGLAV